MEQGENWCPNENQLLLFSVVTFFSKLLSMSNTNPRLVLCPPKICTDFTVKKDMNPGAIL